MVTVWHSLPADAVEVNAEKNLGWNLTNTTVICGAEYYPNPANHQELNEAHT